MPALARLAVAAYIGGLSVALLAGRWPLQGPLLLSVVRGHGLHLGDAVVLLLLSASAALAVLRPRVPMRLHGHDARRVAEPPERP